MREAYQSDLRHIVDDLLDMAELVSTALADATRALLEGDLALELARDTPESGAYPIVLVSYHIACKEYDDAERANNVKAFLEYVASEEGQQAASEAAGSAPIGEGTREQVMSSIEMIQGG